MCEAEFFSIQSVVYLFMCVYLWQVERCPELLDVIVEEFLPTSWRMLGVLLSYMKHLINKHLWDTYKSLYMYMYICLCHLHVHKFEKDKYQKLIIFAHKSVVCYYPNSRLFDWGQGHVIKMALIPNKVQLGVLVLHVLLYF